MNGNPIFGEQGPLPNFNHLTNSPSPSLSPKVHEIGQDLAETGQNREAYPVDILAEGVKIQDGGSRASEESKVAQDIAMSQKNTGNGDQLSDDLLLFVGTENSDGNPHASVNVGLDSTFLGRPNSVILPMESTGVLQREHDARTNPAHGALDGAQLAQNPEVTATLALPQLVVQPDSISAPLVKQNSSLIDALNLSTSKILSAGSSNSGSFPKLAVPEGISLLDLADETLNVQNLGLHFERFAASLRDERLKSGGGAVSEEMPKLTRGETNIPFPLTNSLEPQHFELPIPTSTSTLGISGSPQITAGVMIPAELELVPTLASTVHTPSLDQPAMPLMYIITSRDRNTGATQKFRVTVDSASVATAPIGYLSLSGSLPSVQLGNQWVVQQQPDGTVSGSIFQKDGSSTATMSPTVDGCTSATLNTAVPSITTTTNMTSVDGLSKTHLEMHHLRQKCKWENILEFDDLLILGGSGDDTSGFQTLLLKQKNKNLKEEKVFCCNFEGCQEFFDTKSKVKLHQLIHADDRPHKCTMEGCDWTFPTLYKLKRHLAGHTGARPFSCDECSAQFSTIYNLNMHKKRHEQAETFVCEVKECSQTFSQLSRLNNHLRTHFPERRVKCKFPGCDKSFTSTCAMGSHYRIHDRDETIFPCLVEGCNKVYDKACRLKLHMRSHTGERPFKCTAEGCNWAFTCIQKLSRHMVQHTGDRKYECKHSGCNKLFTRLEHLKTHIKSHTGEKPYACSEKDCNARFASRSSLFMHVKRHKQGYGSKQAMLFNCPMDECNQCYTKKDGLKKHILTVHSIMLPSTYNESELVYIPTENPQAMVDAVMDPSLLQTPTVVRITPAPETNATNHLSLNPTTKDNAAVSTTQSQPNGVVPCTSGAGLIVDSNGSLVSFVNSPIVSQEGTVSSWSLGGLHHENWSGSARTDFMYLQGGKEGRLAKSSESCDSETDGTLTSYIPTNFSMTTTASLTLRDPATGARYVQTQLLQDDPPDESELSFPMTSDPATPDPSTSDLNASAILPATDPSTHAQCPPTSSVDFLQTDREAESSIDGFRESTINLQDLE